MAPRSGISVQRLVGFIGRLKGTFSYRKSPFCDLEKAADQHLLSYPKNSLPSVSSELVACPKFASRYAAVSFFFASPEVSKAPLPFVHHMHHNQSVSIEELYFFTNSGAYSIGIWVVDDPWYWKQRCGYALFPLFSLLYCSPKPSYFTIPIT